MLYTFLDCLLCSMFGWIVFYALYFLWLSPILNNFLDCLLGYNYSFKTPRFLDFLLHALYIFYVKNSLRTSSILYIFWIVFYTIIILCSHPWYPCSLCCRWRRGRNNNWRWDISFLLSPHSQNFLFWPRMADSSLPWAPPPLQVSSINQGTAGRLPFLPLKGLSCGSLGSGSWVGCSYGSVHDGLFMTLLWVTPK